MKYLKQFVIGSSAIIYLPFWYMSYNHKYRKYSYKYYTFLSPLSVGLLKIISLIIADYIGLSMKLRFMIISIINYIGLIILHHYYNYLIYDFTKEQWILYFIRMFIVYLLLWNILIYNIEKYF